ncbi:acetylcholine receptor subunit beta-like 2 isoform X2 [Malaya genurostris]|uniref:acetylcholine receptor subunit beta-like 2 isoform X2 n=1 Tax=Malaya genurostris TaxID=325434 RepID=UPI0026F3B51B|nr:acetylcholine receptor subunit beta-like 2 isoform X2 [Malaya genurostris]
MGSYMKFVNLKLCLFGLIATSYAQASVVHIEANPDAKRLYDDLLSNYNRLIRPVVNNTETLTVWLGLKLSQLIEVSLRNQVMTTNLWVKQKWFDYKLKWDPEEYGGVEMLYVPSEQIWLPDIVLYNNWDGNYEVTLMTKATLKYTGEVFWEPPAIYKSSCEMNVEYFPYDEQTCLMKFGSWTYNGAQVELRHLDQVPGSNLVPIGIDLSEFYLSVEWDMLEIPASRNEEYYPCCPEPFSDITFKLTMRRKTLFYTVNLIIPCVGITFLTVLVFYLPSDSGEKVTLCISILVSLTVFFLLLAEIIPPTSLAVPLLGKYLLFTMILVSLSVWTTVCVLNVWYSISDFPGEFKEGGDSFDNIGMNLPHGSVEHDNIIPKQMSPELLSAIQAVRFIAQHIKDADKDNEIVEDWKFVSMVLDRFFLWVFTFSCIFGTFGIICQSPSLYDTRAPVDQQLSEIPLRKNNFMLPPDIVRITLD